MTNLHASDLDEFRGDNETRRQSPWTSNLQTVGIRYAGLAHQRGKCEALSSVVGLAMEADIYNTPSASIIHISFLSIDASQSKRIKIFQFPKESSYYFKLLVF